MNTFYKLTFVVFLVLKTVCGMAQVQKPARKPDVIHTLSKTSLRVLIEEVNKSNIKFKTVGRSREMVDSIATKDVWKIEWNNGDVEEINPLLVTEQIPSKEAEDDTKFNPAELLVKKKEKSVTMFWERTGFFAGARLGAGITRPPGSAELVASDIQLAYGGGLTIGYRKKAVAVQLEAIYSALKYNVNIPDSLKIQIKSMQGSQSDLLIPLTVQASRKFGSFRVGLTAGGFGDLKAGRGSMKISDQENRTFKTKNCASCTSKELTFGLVGGIGATFLEGPKQAIFIDARWYYNLGDNRKYSIGDNRVNLHLAMVNVGILFHFLK